MVKIDRSIYASVASLALASFLCADRSQAEDQYLLIGGGPTPSEAQVSIETNVIRTQAALSQLGLKTGTTLFGAGNEGLPDVVLRDEMSPETQRWRPVARLFDKGDEAAIRFRHNIVKPDGPFDKATVIEEISRSVHRLQPGDSLLLLYNGHGGQEGDNPSDSSLRLWGGESLTASELSSQLAHLPQSSTLRMVLPQCFSGGFATLMFRNPKKPDIDNMYTNRCGFFSVSYDRTAEGCTASINTGDYRDYTTYFVAALTGERNAPGSLEHDPDSDGDGVVTLLEAHEHAYIAGRSTDIPRSTSEEYLEQWAPWFVNLMPTSSSMPPNRYTRIATQIAATLKIDTDWRRLEKAARASRVRTELGLKRLELRRKQLTETANTLNRRLRNTMLRRWPIATTPYNPAFLTSFVNNLNDVLSWLLLDVDYRQLSNVEAQMADLESQSLEMSRLLSRHDRLLRMMALGNLERDFRRFSASSEKENFKKLIACESWAPGEAQPPQSSAQN